MYATSQLEEQRPERLTSIDRPYTSTTSGVMFRNEHYPGQNIDAYFMI